MESFFYYFLFFSSQEISQNLVRRLLGPGKAKYVLYITPTLWDKNENIKLVSSEIDTGLATSTYLYVWKYVSLDFFVFLYHEMKWCDMMCIFVSTSAGSPRVLRDWETHYLTHPAQEFNILSKPSQVSSNGAEGERERGFYIDCSGTIPKRGK